MTAPLIAPIGRRPGALAGLALSMALMLQLMRPASAVTTGTAGPGSGKFRLPEGAEDGLYEGFLDEHGVAQMRYHGKLHFPGTGNEHAAVAPSSSGNSASNSTKTGGRKLLAGSGVHCQWGTGTTSGDISNAIQQLANWFGTRNCYYVKSWSYKYATATAFACNYGSNGQCYSSGEVWSDENAISNQCGYAESGWYSSYGRTASWWGFC